MEHPHLSVKLPSETDKIFDSDDYDQIITNETTINQPQLNYGFNTFIYTIKNRLDEGWYKKKLESYRKYKYVINPFEHSISLKQNDFQDIHNTTIKKLDIKEKISSRSFFKMWEMLRDFDLIDLNHKNFNSFHMAEAPGGFIQATIKYNEKFMKNPNKSKFFGISITNEIKFSTELQRIYGSGPNRNFYQFKNDSKMDGDITKMSVIDIVKKGFAKEEPDLITADGGFDPVNENYHEQESYMLIFGEIFTAISVQKKGGHFICKFLDMYTNLTVKLVYIISSFYEEVSLYKPYTSRQSNSERYVIAKGFKYNKKDKEYINKYEKLKSIFIKCKAEFDNSKNLIDIFTNFQIPNIYRSIIANYNTKIGNNQYKNINTRLQYFKSASLDGDQFKAFSKIQEESTSFWLNKYINE